MKLSPAQKKIMNTLDNGGCVYIVYGFSYGEGGTAEMALDKNSPCRTVNISSVMALLNMGAIKEELKIEDYLGRKGATKTKYVKA